MSNEDFQALSVFAIMCFSYIIVELILIINSIRSRRRLEHLLRTEKTRGYFGGLRQRLIKHALDNKINSCSQNFFYLNNLYSLILRNPAHYSEISKLLFLYFSKDKNKQLPEVNEKIISDEEKHLFQDTADGLGLIIKDYLLSELPIHIVIWAKILYKFEKEEEIQIDNENIQTINKVKKELIKASV